MEKHLKDAAYYGDLYDRYTVERCRRAVYDSGFKDRP